MGLFKRKRPDDPPPAPEATVVSTLSGAVDVTGASDLREEILHALEEHGIDPETHQVVDANAIPGLNEEIMRTLGQHGIEMGALGAAFGGTAAGPTDPVDQLARLAELHKSGVLSDYEFAVAKQKLLDERWES